MTTAESETSIRASWRQRIDGGDVAFAAITYILFLFLFSAIFVNVIPDSSGLGAGPLPGLAGSALAALVSVGICLNASDTLTRQSLGLRRIPKRWYAFGVLGGLLLPLISVILIAAFIAVVGEAPPGRGVSSPRLAADEVVSAVLLVVIGGVLAPVAEELLFRGVIYTYLRRWGVVLAVVVSALLFGVPHGGFLPIYVAGGIVFAVLYERSGSLLPAMLAHAVYNTLWLGSLALFLLLS